MDLLPASEFTFEELTHAYNQTRVDYVVPMPMNVARLKEYTRVYDVNLHHSCVVVDPENDNLIYGLGMLGMRGNRAWITRLGVLPYGRRLGVGRRIMDGLVAQSKRNMCKQIWLEVIKNNDPAHKLFRKYGFTETRELIIGRRPPNLNFNDNLLGEIKQVTTLNHEDAIILLSHRQDQPNWLNQIETFQNVHNLSALLVEMKGGGRGWVTYHADVLQLTRIIIEVTAGDCTEVTEAILNVLHQRHKRQDAIIENIFDVEIWAGCQNFGYFEAFRRIEMVREL